MADIEAAGGQESEELVFQSVRDAFAGKSVSTLRSRANSLLCYARFKATLSLNDIEPVFPMSERLQQRDPAVPAAPFAS